MSKGQNNNSFNIDQPLCRWCITPLSLSASFENSVCVDCYQQLIRAGLSDEKIFSRKIPASHPTLNFFLKSSAS